jgi:transcriptional regulator with XRE-family HTH domain
VSRNATKNEKTFYSNLGRNIVLARKVAGKSQTDVAGQVEVTFQQLQKWEKGQNRIPVRELVLVASYLEAPVSQLTGADGPKAADSALQELIEQLSNKDLRQILKAWSAIKDPKMRSAIVDFVNSLAAISR